MQRIFHPIGQGAFYSERHDNFNIVYDCGNWRNTIRSDRLVRQSFRKNENIDILFISHFDWDHVNKIKVLKDHAKIKKVVMPLLHDDERYLLLNLYRVLNFNILTLINNPNEFFGDETQIISVSFSDIPESPIEGEQYINIDDLTSSEIQSGSILRKSTNRYHWIYIPYNYDFTIRNRQLEVLQKNAGFDVQRFKKDPNYTLSLIESERKKIHKIYSKLNGNINQNSLVVYSGPLPDESKFEMDCFRYICCSRCGCVRCYCNWNRVACVFTGDADINKIKLKAIYKKFWHHVGTIQVPHHGDVRSFNTDILNNSNYCCPISVGNNNSYSHPSDAVIAAILANESCPVLVTEDFNTRLIQIVEC